MVGQYAVDLASFEQLALPVLTDVSKDVVNKKHKTICIIDEIGKMELFSQSFIHAVQKTLDCDTAFIFGTIPVAKGKPLLLVEEIKNRADVRIFNITRENRDAIMQEIVTAIQDCCK
ncbi:cancer-related nucleoside-triphosphatase-like isoform X1 [Xenopus laevis]|uniref:Cancer-related nucleoside-triphosphatase-like isoform X1 n=2 Tax=Xenopus laevis TaxID=8355 RepID=A0A8J1KT29_XENLA|nr:cancer-related nucleoside-triphosphatase-like isoform X1 [Xenopus laevis]